MEMTEHETRTTAPDSGLRIKTEVKGRDAASAPGSTPDIVCGVHLFEKERWWIVTLPLCF